MFVLSVSQYFRKEAPENPFGPDALLLSMEKTTSCISSLAETEVRCVFSSSGSKCGINGKLSPKSGSPKFSPSEKIHGCYSATYTVKDSSHLKLMLFYSEHLQQLGTNKLILGNVSEVWKIELDMKDTCDRMIIEKMLRDLIENKRADLVRLVDMFGEKARSSVKEGGSSYRNFEGLVENIRSMSLDAFKS
ncbi:hypothetical protein GIB67_007711 [Kingdonia uniflora]|uniref:Uncharacterized protein n=1 Tax=Kingdonia uniflora TaxID=39325 RepID=A0A7J7N214_9MAGN|nr:hypothetical protein GIB67_007711 [Kingdonia uniflora]